MLSSFKRVAAGAAILLVAGAFVVPPPAGASFSGTTGVLTSSLPDGIHFANGAPRILPWQGGQYWAVNPPFSVAKWSPDGSRAAFHDHLTGIDTVRYNDGFDISFLRGLPSFPEGFDRRDATYRSSGKTVVYAERAQTADAHWHLSITSNSPGWGEQQVTPEDGADYTMPDGGPNLAVVFQRRLGSDPAEVWIWDGLGSTTDHFAKITEGTEPALSPDGAKVAYIFGGHLWTVGVDGTGAAQVTTDDVLASRPSWSPDATTIAFSADAMVRTVPAAGGASVATSLTGVPTFLPSHKDAVSRLFGSSRFETATATSQYAWKNSDNGTDPRLQASAVVLSRSDTFADALGGATLAAAKGGPLLLTLPTQLLAATKAEIQRVLGTDLTRTVWLLGGTGALSTSVENAVRALGYRVQRLAGADRYATSVVIADEVASHSAPGQILVATGNNFPDALAAGAAAGSFDLPGSDQTAVVILSAGKTLTEATADYLNTYAVGGDDTNLYGIGGDAAASLTAYDRYELVGKSRYETAAIVADWFFGSHSYAGVATGDNWPDALAGGALLATLNGPLLLTPTNGGLNATTSFIMSINSTSIDTVLVFGGSAVVSDGAMGQAGTIISGPAGFNTVVAAAPGAPGFGAALRQRTVRDPFDARSLDRLPGTGSGVFKSAS